MKAVILAAGKGTRLAPLTDDRPKPLIEVGGRALLLRTLDCLAEVGLRGADVIVIGGYRQDVLERTLVEAGFGAVQVVRNERYDDYNNFYSLYCARAAAEGQGVLQIDGDVLFDAALLPRVLGAPGPGVLAVDVRPDLDDETMKVEVRDGRIVAVSKKLDPRTAVGEYIGVTRLDAALAALVMAELGGFPAEALTHEYYEHAYHRLAGRGGGPFRVCDVSDLPTIEIDDAVDLGRAERLLQDLGRA